MAEVVRRALLAYREQVLREDAQQTSKRRALLASLYDSFAEHDAEAEVARLKREDAYF